MRVDLKLLLARFDLESYVLEFAAEKVGRYEYLLPCPSCGREKVSVNLEKNRWRCFLCEKYTVDGMGFKRAERGAGGPLALVKWMEDLDTRAAIERVAQFVSHALGSPNELPELNFTPAHAPQLPPLSPTGLPKNCVAVEGIMPYLARRQITLEDARGFGLGWCSSGWVANRLIFPVWENGACIYWQARAMWDEAEHDPAKGKFRKTLNPSRSRNYGDVEVLYFGSGDVLLNLEQASRYPRVCITEGPTSCIRAGPSAVATFGKQLQPAQISRMVAAGVRAVDFMWDGPSRNEPQGAWSEMMRAAGQLAPFMDVRLVFLPHGDPGDYTREELDAYRASSRPYSTGTLLL